ncbi:MAG: methyltransferase domain-containing protein [Planctomycetota bacterium]|nr:methyltransferase domain-containing protein [Planctomycetota bacterium]MDA1114318.1 methyltransferase domain-containing protein [Planctomycetota bacterium]
MASPERLEDLQQRTVNDAVSARYAEGANAVQPELCCPVDYDATYLKVMPEEILERDYGCGDPSKYVKRGETVLDLGSGGGKICYIASQVVGPEGHVIGVDMTPDMLDLARRHKDGLAEKIGWSNVDFFRGNIENLKLDLDRLDGWLAKNPVANVAGYEAMQMEIERLGREEIMVADESIDVVVSNCVLNLVAPELKCQMFEEIFRTLKPGGRAVISDIVCDKEVPLHLQQDSDLWSGCISGAFEEEAFLQAFLDAGMEDVEILVRQSEPWQVVEGIEFRSMTVVAYRPVEVDCCAVGGEVVYHGPFSEIADDAGNLYSRGCRVAVDAHAFEKLSKEPFVGMFTRISEQGETVADAPSSGCC